MTRIAAPIRDVFIREGHLAADAIGRVQAEAVAGGDPRSVAELHRNAVLSTWSDGLELGLAIGVRDVASARRLLDWIRTEILENDPATRQATELSVQAFLEVLDR